MTRILIICTNPKCRQHIALSATTQVRIIANEKAEFVHEDLEKAEPELGVGDCVVQESTKPEITPSQEKPRTNEAQWFEAVMTEWQPRDLFLAVVAKCKELGMFTKSLRTLQDIYDNGIYTTIQRDAILLAYEEAKE